MALKFLDRLNGTTRVVTMLVVAAAGLVTGTVAIESRYAKASEVQAVQRSADTILDVLKIQYLTRQGVLQLKKEQGTITPSEAVELKGLAKILATLDKRGQ